MTFTESIQTCFSKYADFNGRATRSEFWYFMLFLFAASIILSLIFRPLCGLFSLATLVPSIAVGARRLHDTNRSGWLQLLNLIPFVGWIILIIFYIEQGKEPNRFGNAAAIAVPGPQP